VYRKSVRDPHLCWKEIDEEIFLWPNVLWWVFSHLVKENAFYGFIILKEMGNTIALGNIATLLNPEVDQSIIDKALELLQRMQGDVVSSHADFP
jgi:hypothetical protein